MVHACTGQHAYSHWVLRLKPLIPAITHMSAGPVIQSSDYERLEGYFQGVLNVGSFRVFLAPNGQQVCEYFGMLQI